MHFALSAPLATMLVLTAFCLMPNLAVFACLTTLPLEPCMPSQTKSIDQDANVVPLLILMLIMAMVQKKL
jgi:hypothetical protein